MRVAVIGMGLIGGSLLRALARAGHDVRGHDTDPATRALARTAAAQAPAYERWQVTASVPDAAAGCDLAVIAVPLPQVAAVAGQIEPGVPLTDVTSVKSAVREIMADRTRFVGGHPMAGRESAGFAASDPELFRECAWALCLEPETRLDDWLRLAALVTSLGARVVPVTAAGHDAAVARISHVPHLLAAALTRLSRADPLALTLAAGSYRDGTRVAASNPALSAAMCAGNAPAVRAALAELVADLSGAAGHLESTGDWFAPAAAVRARWPYPPGEEVSLPAEPAALLRLGQAGGWVTAVAPDLRTVTARAGRPGPAGSPAGR